MTDDVSENLTADTQIQYIKIIAIKISEYTTPTENVFQEA